MIKYDFKTFMDIDGVNNYKDIIHKIKNKLEKKESGDIFTDIDKCISKKEIEKIKKVSKYIRNNCDVFLVIGVGGSYHGSKALIDMFTNKYKSDIEIIYTGYSLNSSNLREIID